MVNFMKYAASVLLLISTGLLIMPMLSAPVIKDMSLVQIIIPQANSSSYELAVSLGPFGYCTYVPGARPNQGPAPHCSKASIGYNVTSILDSLDIPANAYGEFSSTTLRGLSYGLVLHPIAAAVALLATVIALLSARFGLITAFVVTAIAWIVAAIAFSIDIALFVIARSHHFVKTTGINFVLSSYEWDRSNVRLGLGGKSTVGALATLTLGGVLALIACCTARKEKRWSRDAPALSTAPATGQHPYYDMYTPAAIPMTQGLGQKNHY